MDERLVDKITKKVLQELEAKGLLYEKTILCLNFSAKQEKEIRDRYPDYQFHFASVIQGKNTFDEIWIGRLSTQDLAQTALGLRSSLGNLLQELAKGKKIRVLSSEQEAFSSSPLVPESILELWQKYKERLEDMGVIFKGEEKGEVSTNVGQDQKTFRLDKKLVTQESLAHLRGQKVTLILPRKAKVTPLALDFCKENKIEIKRESERD